jgi:iron complex outermembrane receptor protein
MPPDPDATDEGAAEKRGAFMKRLSFHHFLFASTALAIGLTASAASAQENAPPSGQANAIEEIVVTARRREENLQTTPVAITAVTSATLEARGVQSLVEISRIAPNMQIQDTPGSTGSAGVAIRGIAYGDNVIGQDSPVGIYIDGIPSNRVSTAVMDLVEPDRVEVLRGPQGTLFGRNTTAGAILITSHTPSDQFGGQVKAGYGTWNNQSFQARIDTGVFGDSGIKASFAYQHRSRDGSQNNLEQPRDKDPGAEKTDAYWFKVVGEWGALKATLTGDRTDQYAVPVMLQIVDAPVGLRNLFANSPNFGGNTLPITQTPLYTVSNYGTSGLQHVWTQGIAAQVEYQVADYLTLKSISGVRAYRRDDPANYGPSRLRVPNTLAPASILTFNGAYGFNQREQGQRQFSQEFQALGTVGDFNYVAGLYYFKESAWDVGVTRLVAASATGATGFDSVTPRVYTVDSKSKAAFAQIDWRPSFLDKKLELSGGIRYTKDSRDFDQTQAIVRARKLDTKNTSFLASANYQWTDGVMTYVRFSTGYRAGGFNVRAGATADPTYLPEKIKAYEAGFKIDAFNRRVRLNGAAFINKYKDLQVGQFVAPSAAGGGGALTFNANAKYKGFELETVVVPVDGLTLTANVGILDPEYTQYPVAAGAGGVLSPGCSALSGTTAFQNCAAVADVPASPHQTADFSAVYTFPAQSYGELSLAVDYSYRGKIEWGAYAGTSPFKAAVAAKSYGLLGARVALSEIPLGNDARAELAAFGRNLTNEKYVTQGIDFVLFGTKNFGDRRTFGIEGKVEF